MVRRQLVHQQPVAKAYSLSDLKGKAHVHFCHDRECRQVYFCNCHEPETNGPCETHRGAMRGLSRSREIQDCCLNNCEQVTSREEILRYELAGPGPWYQCRTCRRCHGWPCVF